MVYLVGAGPGDPGLITVRGLELLKRAEVVIYDYLAPKKLLKHVPRDAEMIYAGKKGGVKHTHTQEEINRMLVGRARAGKTVVRLKGGDPFIFGRGGEEVEELVAAGLPFEVVPGVTSATAAATFAGIPITHRRYTATVAFVTGHEDPTKPSSNIAWDKLATGVGTLVIYMGIKNLPAITANLIKHGRDPQTPVAVVRWASTPEQRTVVGTLATITEVVREAHITPPALVVVGDVVSLRDTINWFEKRALFGKKVLVTRTREQASELVHRLEELGADCLECATIAIRPPESMAVVDRELDRLDRYDWVLFTSINAVGCFFERLLKKGLDARALHNARVAVVGKATAESLAGFGIRADLLPEEFTGDGLAASLVNLGVAEKKILIPRAEVARETLPQALTQAGAEVMVAPVYRNVVPVDSDEGTGPTALRQALTQGKIDVVTFTSSSTVSNFIKMLAPAGPDELKELLAGVAVAAIGPITARTAVRHGLAVDIQPERFTIPEMVDSIVAHFS
ncbi:MAG: uroporphyrinogen-III C-methyltransferase [Desulfobacterales bacterium]|nr:uroporphyrinogen-III C-methyltransferase [Desulfobacterales bacterium]